MPRKLLIILIVLFLFLGITAEVNLSGMFPYVESGITGIIILLQLHFFLLGIKHIKFLENFFPDKIHEKIVVSEDGLITKTLQIISSEFDKIINTTNEYLENNKGAVDFNIIKEISERQINSIDKSINATISVPLYVGLLGTMFGIIYGLLGISYPLTDTSLSILLDGVKIAMVGSFFGLGFTIIGNAWIYKSAKTINDTTKDAFYTFIQTKILGTNNSSLTVSLNRLNQGLKQFTKSFTTNITDLNESTLLVGEVSRNQVSSLEHQKTIIDEIKEIGLTKISRTNLEILDRLQNSMHIFDRLNENLKPSFKLIQQNNDNLQKIDLVYSNIAGYNGRLQTIFENIYQSSIDINELGNFLKQHYSGIESLSEGTKELVNEQKNVLTGENETFKLFLVEKQEKYTKVLDGHLNDFSTQMRLMGDKMLETISSQEKGIQDLTGAFDKVLQKNKQFLSDKIVEMQTEWEKSLKDVLSESKINKLEINIEYLKNEFIIQNEALIKISNNLNSTTGLLDEETKESLKIMGDYFKKEMNKKSVWKRLIQYWTNR